MMLEKMIKVVENDGKEKRSLIGVTFYDEKYLNLATLKGVAISPKAFRAIVVKFFPEILKIGKKLSFERKHPYRVRTHVGMSGAEDKWIEYIVYKGNFPVVKQGGHIHISMSDKLNWDINSMWVGDLIHLFNFNKNEDFSNIKISEISMITTNYIEREFHYDELPKDIEEL